MNKEHLMTVQELYDFAVEHNMEDATIWFQSGTNVQSSVSYAKASVFSFENTNKRIELIP